MTTKNRYQINLVIRYKTPPSERLVAYRSAIEGLYAMLPQPPETMTFVSQILRAQFTELISKLPDEFFGLSQTDKVKLWNEIYKMVLNGVRDIDVLADYVKSSIANINRQNQ